MATKKRRIKPPEGIEILGIKKQTQLQPKGRKKRSKYDDIIDAAARMRPGEVLELGITDEDEDLVVGRNRISAVIRRYAQPQTSHKLKIRVTENDTIGIYCYKSTRLDE